MDRSMVAEFHARDFVETPEGLLFAVVESEPDSGRLIAYLRYRREGAELTKLSTREAKDYLESYASHYIFYSQDRDTWVQSVPLDDIACHLEPRVILQQICSTIDHDPLHESIRNWCGWLEAEGLDTSGIGVTGSVLLGAHRADSDLDMVCYDRDLFHNVRAANKRLIEQGRLRELSQAEWQQAYDRRRPALTFAEYVWHEKRKEIKALIGGNRLDLSLVTSAPASSAEPSKKLGQVSIQAKVVDATNAFDSPASWTVEHEVVERIVSFTATYTGQAEQGEWVEAAGYLESIGIDRFQLIVGSSREAPEEFIRVLCNEND